MVEIVITIPDGLYAILPTYADDLAKIILSGTVLPKGHGRLKDAGEILQAMDSYDKYGYASNGGLVRNPDVEYVPYVHYDDMIKAVTSAPTLIGADKEDIDK